ncbi:MAG: carboxypeptidase M32 [Deltaproteobacteria bacterium]|nr:carboxypeptidase M32 [Deltaproteobacteria bacterium]
MRINDKDLNHYYASLSEIYKLEGINALLYWDQKTYMPPKAAQHRASQLALVDQLIHQRKTSPELQHKVQDLLQCEGLKPEDRINLQRTNYEITRNQKLSEEFVATRSRLQAECYSLWIEARPSSSFKSVAPHLEKLVELARQEADLTGYSEHPYDALLEVYEPFSRLSKIKPVLLELGGGLRQLIDQIPAKGQDLSSAKEEDYLAENQHQLNLAIASDLGFESDEGRLDVTAHPFASDMGPYDYRITTRYDETDFLSAVFSTLHETGHALYEMGLPKEYLGSACGRAISLGIHESQSRFWENCVGRSKPYARYLHRLLGRYLPEAAENFSEEQLYRAANKVQPSLIRVEADEVTYSLHVVIRMLLEEQLISGNLAVSELPDAWNDQYKNHLGLDVPADCDGVLQDVHWYTGSFGYFPTYAFGNIYGAMMHRKMRSDIPEMDSLIENGEFAQILSWLRERVHKFGTRFEAAELASRASGMPVSSQPFLDYLREKHLG